MQAQIDAIPTAGDIDAFWLVINAEVVFIMQVGFMLLEVGSVRAQHAKSICVKNVVDFLFTTICWLSIGYPLAFGQRGALGYFGGTTYHFGHNIEDAGSYAWAGWFFQWSFASACCTIVSGSGAERCSFKGYVVSTLLLSCLVYPCVVHWCWSDDAWLTKDGYEFYDFAGSGVVHLTGGIAAFALASIVGPRDGRFTDNNVNTLAPHNLVLSAAGALLLITGWFGFNGGSVLQASGGNASAAGRACAITAIGTAMGGLFSFYYTFHKYGFINLEKLMNGMLAGAVSVTAGARVLFPFEALLTGVIGGLIYSVCSELLVHYRIDDPLDASPIHGACGVWGLLAVGLFANDAGVTGLVHGNPAQLGHQILGALVIIVWSGGVTGLVFSFMKWYSPTLLRVPLEIELAGDVVLYGGSAYPQFSTGSTPPQGHLAIVVTDVKGSTALWEWNADVMGEATALHERVLRDNIARLDGYEFSHEGDSFSVAFHNSLDALKFATICQTDLMQVEWPAQLYEHPDGSKEGELYNGLRVRMMVGVGNAKKTLNKETNLLDYDGEVVTACTAVLNAINDGGVVVASTECLQDLQGKFSHRIYELGKFEMQDMGMYSCPDIAEPIALIQAMPQWLQARPGAQLSGVKMVQKPFSQAPGVQNPGLPVAIMFCTLQTKAQKRKSEAHKRRKSLRRSIGGTEIADLDAEVKQDELKHAAEDKEVESSKEAMTGLLSTAVFECGGYVTKTSNGVALVAFDNAQDGFGFINKMFTLLQTSAHANLTFRSGMHVGIPNSVAANKTSGKADYMGPAVNATARLLSLAAETPSFKYENVSVAVSHSAWVGIDATNQKEQLHLQGKFQLKGVAGEVEVFAFRPGAFAGLQPVPEEVGVMNIEEVRATSPTSAD